MTTILDGSTATLLGWVLVHFIWQGALIALVVWAALGLARDASTRYVACCGGLAAMACAPLATAAIMIVSAATGGPASAGVAAAPVVASAGPWSDRLLAVLPRLWLAGVVLLQARLLWQWLAAQRLRAHGTSPAPRAWRDTVAEITVALGIRRPVAILESAAAGVPMLIGWLRPVILVPACMATGLAPDQLRAVIAHELAHVRRHDYLVNLMQSVLESALFYHPAVWWLSSRLRVEREYCCDDVAVRVGGDALRYAQALAILESRRYASPEPVMASTGGSLMNRIQRVLGVNAANPNRAGWLVPVVMAGALGLLSVLAVARTTESREVDRQAAVDGLDLVEVLQSANAEQSRLLEILRDAGYSNREMLLVLRALEPNEEVRHAVDRALKEQAYIQDRLAAMRERLGEQARAGKITEAEIAEHLAAAQTELRHEFRHQLHKDRQIREAEIVRARLEQQIADIERRVAAGEISSAEAKQAIDEARRSLRETAVRRRYELAAVRDVEKQMQALHDEVAAAVEAGRMTEAEARERLDAARKQLHEQLMVTVQRQTGMAEDDIRAVEESLAAAVRAGRLDETEARERLRDTKQMLHDALMGQLDGRGREVMEAAHAKLMKLREQIKADVEAGRLTEQEAAEKLHAAMAKLHEHLLQMQDQFLELHKHDDHLDHDAGHDHDHD